MSHSVEKRKLAPHYCEIPGCGFSDYVQRHRIKPGRDGGKYRVGNVIALCPNHHAYADDGTLTMEILWEIVKLRLGRDLAAETLTEEVYQNSIQYIESVYGQQS